MNLAKQTTTIIFTMALSFLLGWSMRGDRIYSGIVGSMAEAVQVRK